MNSTATKKWWGLLFLLFHGYNAHSLSSGQVNMVRTTSPQFTLDSNKPCTDGPRAAYVGIKITNTGAVGLKDLRLDLTGMTGTGFALLGPLDSGVYIGRLAAGESRTAYFYFKYPCVINRALNLSFVASDDQSGTISMNTSIITRSMISANAGGLIAGRSTSYTAVPGSLLTDTITYEFGNVQKDDEIEFQPNGDTLFLADELQLINCKVISSDIPNAIPVDTTDQLYFISPTNYGGSNNFVKVVFYYIYKLRSSSTIIRPYAALTSGSSNMKYTGNFLSAIADTIIQPVSNPCSSVRLTRSVNKSIASIGDTVRWTIILRNLSSARIMIDEIRDSLYPDYPFVGIDQGSELADSIFTEIPDTGQTGVFVFKGGMPYKIFPYVSIAIESNDSVILEYLTRVPDTTSSLGHESFSSVILANDTCGSAMLKTCVGCPHLPVEMLYFTGTALGNSILLQWATATEINNSHFEIERQDAEGIWQIIGIKDGSGFSNTLQSYQFLDPQPLPGVNYYRLRQIDFDGAFEYSRVIALSSENRLGKSELKMYPNPALGLMVIEFPMGESSTPFLLNVNDLHGRLLHEINGFSGKNHPPVLMDVSKWQAGIYFITCSGTFGVLKGQFAVLAH